MTMNGKLTLLSNFQQYQNNFLAIVSFLRAWQSGASSQTLVFPPPVPTPLVSPSLLPAYVPADVPTDVPADVPANVPAVSPHTSPTPPTSTIPEHAYPFSALLDYHSAEHDAAHELLHYFVFKVLVPKVDAKQGSPLGCMYMFPGVFVDICC
jgi:hypothetical protein